ncbi:predicted protein [Uncinocarpus reesii 1704]|uniref:Endopolyphosphatase n=1 Tax=Uncinocarpus reesii (strain UAMH 1704) TaxID=336963 RepID=C4JTU1_UNCRE|nr:uncharacterized protein UREG_05880 [Uncinocarpus reesii 1704]EEP81038.1 predicted protein [Uncinocarpus reesii 1704]
MAQWVWILPLLAICPHGIAGQAQQRFQLEADIRGENVVGTEADNPRLHGRFLHITDIHPDPHYKPFSNSDSKHECHRGKGHAGYLGSAGSDCDAPFALVNATFRWIEENLSNSIDFVVWTGDSARHDNDENIPRTEKEIISLNQAMVENFQEVFSEKKKSDKHLRIPIVPTIGNNDMMPHNIFRAGPNRWTRIYASMWNRLIPEEQRHSFIQGGWFYVEVVPNRLAVISLNTMYFFDSNNAVDGCNHKSEPGYEHMEWLRIQLQFMRDRNMKAILIGHVPPARTASKRNWTESCWQKYTLWLKQYRDIIVGSVFGHMNIDHFMLHDFQNLKIGDQGAITLEGGDSHTSDELTTQSRTTYLRSLRDLWAKLPSPPSKKANPHLAGWIEQTSKLTVNKSKKKYHRQIGGRWAERYALSLVSPSVVPNYFPTLRIIEYNTSGLSGLDLWSHHDADDGDVFEAQASLNSTPNITLESELEQSKKKGRTKKKKKHRKKKKKPPKFTVPTPPSSTAPPGPAYSNQPFTWLGYSQYFANITRTNAQLGKKPVAAITPSWREYQLQKAEDPTNTFGGDPFKFEVEYDTRTDKAFGLKDMTVKSYLKLARKIADSPELTQSCISHGSSCGNLVAGKTAESENENLPFFLPEESKGVVSISRKNVWKWFLRRAFVGYFSDKELHDLIDGV